MAAEVKIFDVQHFSLKIDLFHESLKFFKLKMFCDE